VLNLEPTFVWCRNMEFRKVHHKYLKSFECSAGDGDQMDRLSGK
jgi:hypothetical protein